MLCVGAGGLGSPAALYLAAAGVGTLGLVDFDVVDASNLQRQILHGTPDVGRPKLQSARDRLTALNPEVRIETARDDAVVEERARDASSDYDVILDGTDNFPTRYLVNDACVLLGKPNVYGSIFRFDGQASVFATKGGPCYRCLYPEPPPPGLVPSCAEGGVLGVLPGVIGTIQATETIKLILGAASTLVGRLLLYDAWTMRFRELKLRRDPECPVCGDHPTIRELIDYDQFCGVTPHAVLQSAGQRRHAGDDGRGAEGRGSMPVRPSFVLDVREPHEYPDLPNPGLDADSARPARRRGSPKSRPTTAARSSCTARWAGAAPKRSSCSRSSGVAGEEPDGRNSGLDRSGRSVAAARTDGGSHEGSRTEALSLLDSLELLVDRRDVLLDAAHVVSLELLRQVE